MSQQCGRKLRLLLTEKRQESLGFKTEMTDAFSSSVELHYHLSVAA